MAPHFLTGALGNDSGSEVHTFHSELRSAMGCGRAWMGKRQGGGPANVTNHVPYLREGGAGTRRQHAGLKMEQSGERYSYEMEWCGALSYRCT